jgi:predicted transposase/invertase (TIGR01784 family)
MMNRKISYINPFNDLAFKRIFGQDQNKSVLIDFLNGLLLGERHIVDVTYGDKEQVLDEEQSSSMIYDVFCTSDTGEKFIVEMQNKSHRHFIDRMVCYASRTIQRQRRKEEEEKYSIKAVYCIVFMNFKCEGIDDKVVSNERCVTWTQADKFLTSCVSSLYSCRSSIRASTSVNQY